MKKQAGYNLTTFGKHSHYNLVTIPSFVKIPKWILWPFHHT